MKKILKDIREGMLLGLCVVALLCSFFLLLGFIALPIILAVYFSPWWLFLLIPNISISFGMLMIFANNYEDDYI